MRRALLDTDILSELLKKQDPAVVSRGTAYARVHGVYTFTSVTSHEVVFGLQSKGAYSQLKDTLAWLGKNDEITPAAEDYLEAAKIRATARQQGNIIHLPDSLIAAVALRLRLRLVTGNTRDFEAIRRTGAPLQIENRREIPFLH
jgi:predicted nucleic acid-binding protein